MAHVPSAAGFPSGNEMGRFSSSFLMMYFIRKQ